VQKSFRLWKTFFRKRAVCLVFLLPVSSSQRTYSILDEFPLLLTPTECARSGRMI
jgi:hypothetical protein